MHAAIAAVVEEEGEKRTLAGLDNYAENYEYGPSPENFALHSKTWVPEGGE